MPLTLIAIRHGLTDNNDAGILQGQRVNDPLNAAGRQQAIEITAALQVKKGSITALYASPLQRTMQTAEPLAHALGLPILKRVELQERDFGTLSGQKWPDIPDNTDNVLKKKDKALQYDYQPYGGESVGQVRTRLREFLSFLRQNHPDQTVIIVTHSGILRLLHDELQIPQYLELPPGSMSQLQL